MSSKILAGLKFCLTNEYFAKMVDILDRKIDVAAIGVKYNQTEPYKVDSTAIIPVHGVLSRRANMFSNMSGGVSTEILQKQITTANNDNSINRIILDIDSPGGEVNGVAAVADLIKNSPKPVTAFVKGMAASGAYWIASAASRIVAEKTSEVGSIGAVMTMSTGKDETKIQIVSTQSPDKRIDASTDEGRKKLQIEVDDIAEIFISEIANNRKTNIENVLKTYGHGGTMIASKALAAGMIDEINNLENIITEAKMADEEKTPEINVEAEIKAAIETQKPEIEAFAIEKEHIRQVAIYNQSNKHKIDCTKFLFDSSKSVNDFNSHILDTIQGRATKVLNDSEAIAAAEIVGSTTEKELSDEEKATQIAKEWAGIQ